MTNKKEEWRDIPNYEGVYMVSDRGRVKSLDRKVVGRDGRNRKVVGRLRKCTVSNTGYRVVQLKVSPSCKSFQVHQLVAMAFLNHIPCGWRVEVDHIDGDILNNSLDNLQLLTRQEHRRKKNKSSSGYTGVFKMNSGNFRARITEGGKKKHLGSFKTELEASEAYQNYIKTR